ncbi:polysaccharide lyase 8 family protein [Microbacterium sp. KUDC0406]|uniref:polysaccharide lyase 8 family protein n=1 Tax=Microbacterium sp. KUDC0406 TaxID=2909588 RepID=UPI001F2A5ED0|nr:polysaccharide lyase 8 family protein [Microbacterium sp. KUDC0406]UJP10061.1 polysaccharide lyase 8 family protein [Microbacterium sp. KUDC0406]
MLTPSRRNVLQLGGLAAAAVLFAQTGPLAVSASVRPLAVGVPELETLRLRWVETLTGRGIIAANPTAFAAAIAKQDKATDTLLAKVSPTATRFFSDQDWAIGATDIAKSNSMRMNYVGILSLAVSWATPGSKHEGSQAVLDTALRGLAHMHEKIYNTSTSWWGNWWSWNIGAAQPLANAMAILHDRLQQSEIDAYCAAIDHFLPERDPRKQQHPSGPQFSDGANRVDICQSIIVRSIVQPDAELLRSAVSALSDTWQYVTSGNGFFRDGSFVQHSTIGYTGTYGLVLLGGLAKLFSLLAGSSFDITDPSRSNITKVVESSFAPLMFRGQMMDSVRGRAVSRFAERSITDGNDLIEHTLRLAQSADAKTAARWRGLCRQWIEGNTAANITATTSIVRLSLVTELLGSDVAPVADPTGPRFFPAMDRLVHRSADGAWALCVAMCSNRIAWHEGTEAENFTGVKTSQGMTYLYLREDDDHFDDEFWPTSDLAAPAGTTVDLTPLPRNPEGEWGEETPQNEWTGGVTFEDTALAAMHLVAPGGTGLVARKAWFTLPDGIVALGTGISTGSDGELRTIVEHRNLGEDARRLVVDGRPVTVERTLPRARWAHLDGVGGYVFLDRAARVIAGVAAREGSWQGINTGTAAGTEVVHRRMYGTLALSHGTGSRAGGGYAYLVLPGADAKRTAAAARSPKAEVLRNDETAQAIRHSRHVTAVAFWKAGRVDDISVDRTACVIARKTPGMVRMSVSDPTQSASRLVIELADTRVRRAKGTDARRVSVSQRRDGVRLTIDVSGTAGETLEFSLHS